MENNTNVTYDLICRICSLEMTQIVFTSEEFEKQTGGLCPACFYQKLEEFEEK